MKKLILFLLLFFMSSNIFAFSTGFEFLSPPQIGEESRIRFWITSDTVLEEINISFSVLRGAEFLYGDTVYQGNIPYQDTFSVVIPFTIPDTGRYNPYFRIWNEDSLIEIKDIYILATDSGVVADSFPPEGYWMFPSEPEPIDSSEMQGVGWGDHKIYGRITYYDKDKGGYRPLPHVKVIVYSWGWPHVTYTDEDGYYSVTIGGLWPKPIMIIVWANNGHTHIVFPGISPVPFPGGKWGPHLVSGDKRVDLKVWWGTWARLLHDTYWAWKWGYKKLGYNNPTTKILYLPFSSSSVPGKPACAFYIPDVVSDWVNFLSVILSIWKGLPGMGEVIVITLALIEQLFGNSICVFSDGVWGKNNMSTHAHEFGHSVMCHEYGIDLYLNFVKEP